MLSRQGWGGKPHPARVGQIYASLLAYFTQRVAAIVTGLGKRVASWEDSYEKVTAAARGSRRMTTTSAFPAPTDVPLAYPPSLIQGWKCWVDHADSIVAIAATDGMVTNASKVPSGDASTVRGAGRAVLQSSCWYLDYSSTWADYYRHWPLPEHRGALTMYQTAFTSHLATLPASPPEATHYPVSLFARHPYWGGEGAIWAERIDASNFNCRVWPRLGVPSEVTWSESLAFDRYARQYGGDPPLASAWNKGPSAAEDRVQALFAAPRFASFTRLLLHRGLAASPTAVFSIDGSWWQSSAPPPPLSPQFDEGSEQFAFNGLCPGIEQTIQRSPERLSSFLRPVVGGHRGLQTAPAASASPIPRAVNDSTRPITFVSWNIHEGGGSHARYLTFLSLLREIDADVVGLVEANHWDEAARRTEGSTVNGELVDPAFLASHVGIAQALPRRLVLEHERGDEGLGDGSDERLDERLYATGGKLPAPRSLSGGPQDLDPLLHDQNAAFRRRAASAGFIHAHILVAGGGFHLALLSSKSMTVVLTDTTHFERGLIVADVAGVRFMLVHLHAQSAVERAKEAAHVRGLVAIYTAAGFPVIVLGDFNSPSPVDAACHAAEGLVDSLLLPAVPSYLRNKYMCNVKQDAGCGTMRPAVGPLDTTGVGRDWRVDYRPLQALIHAAEGAVAGQPLVDLALVPPTTDWRATLTFGPGNATCLISYPTASLDAGADDAEDNGHVPLRIDFALANSLSLEEFPHLACSVGLTGADGRLMPAMLKASDHLPVVCRG